MVDLLPPIEELIDYGKYAFLTEMHSIASHIVSSIDDTQTKTYINLAIQIIERERTNMRSLFSMPYERPYSNDVITFILRCAVFYLQNGLWYDISNAEFHGMDLNENDKEHLKNCFYSIDSFNNLYVLEKPIIELTNLRLQMMTYFDDMQNSYSKDPEIAERDPLFEITIEHNTIEKINDSVLYNEAELISPSKSMNNLFLSDEDYLSIRENQAWAAFKSFQVAGSIFTLIWFSILVGFGVSNVIHEANASNDQKSLLTTGVCIGYGIMMLLSELLSFRICFVWICRPQNHICCIYPGITLYGIQYFASWIGGICMILCLFLYRKSTSDVVNFLILQHMLSVIVPLFFICCFFTKHKRVNRKFKWVRVGFFKSCCWVFVRILFCLLFTPGIHGVQYIISTAIRNKPRITKHVSRKT